MGSAGDSPAVIGDSPTTPAGPGEVVGAEVEELGGLRDLVGGERAAETQRRVTAMLAVGLTSRQVISICGHDAHADSTARRRV
jgi:hypothetical protein